jgi:hypothetical protein
MKSINVINWQQDVLHADRGRSTAALLMEEGKMKCRFLFMLMMLAAVCARADVGADMAFEKSVFMSQNYYDPWLLGGIYSLSGAASSVNIAYDQNPQANASKWRIEEQRFGRDWVLYGIVHGDAPVPLNTPTGRTQVTPIEFGIRILQWGLNQEQSDGRYACDDYYHSSMFFVESVSDACLALQVSQYAAQYESWIASAIQKNHLTATWLVSIYKRNETPSRELRYGHRYWLNSCALYLTYVLTGDATLSEYAFDLIDAGAAAQLSDGVNPESGGYDSSYQAVGLVYACRLSDFLTDATELSKTFTMLTKGEAWEETMVEPDGIINTEGNTRVGSCQEVGPNGTCKTVAYNYALASFYHWSLISANPAYATEANLVVSGWLIVLNGG